MVTSQGKQGNHIPSKKTIPAIFPLALQPLPDELPRVPFYVKLEQGKRDRAGPTV